MDKLKFKRSKLLESVRDNRDKHQREYKEAVDGYRDEVIEQLKKKINLYQTELARWKSAETVIEIDPYVSLGLRKPEQYLKDYDRVIKMLDMSHEDEIELNHQEFAQYVMDDWAWKEQFSTTTALYNKK